MPSGAKLEFNVRRTLALLKALRAEADVWKSHPGPAGLAGQVAMRARIRALFAAVEGALFCAKRDLLVESAGLLAPEDQVLLAEKQYGVDRQGRPVERPLFIGVVDNVRYTLEAHRRLWGRMPRIDYGGREWAAFRRAVTIRNRLAHPKSAADLRVSRHEVAVVAASASWFHQQVATLYERYSKRLARRARRAPRRPTMR